MHNHSNEKTMSSDVCDITIIHQDVVDRVAREMAKSPSATTMADFLKALADPTRLKVIQVLRYSELCVCDLTSLVGISVSGLSHQLRYLRNKNIVKFRKEGKLAYYSLADDHVGLIIDLVSKHINE